MIQGIGLKDTKYKAAIDFAEGVVLLGSDGTILDANERYCKLYNLDKAQFGEISFSGTLENESKPVFDDKFLTCKSEKKVFRVKLRKKNCHTTVSIVETTCVPFFDEAGVLGEVVLLVSDVTNDEISYRKKVHELLKQRQVALDKIRADKLKSDEQIAQLEAELEIDKASLEKLSKELRVKQAKMDLIAIRLQEVQLNMSFENALAAEVHRSKRYKRPLSVVLFGMDRIESIIQADEQSGDRALMSFHSVVREFVRLCDMLFLEKSNSAFMMLLPETPQIGAKRLCEKLQEHIFQKMPFLYGKKVTCSFVIVEFNENTENHSETIDFARATFEDMSDIKSARGQIVLL